MATVLDMKDLKLNLNKRVPYTGIDSDINLKNDYKRLSYINKKGFIDLIKQFVARINPTKSQKNIKL
jgi:hypothetical protein